MHKAILVVVNFDSIGEKAKRGPCENVGSDHVKKGH